MLLVFSILTFLGICYIRKEFFSYCTFDDETGIEFSSGFSKAKKIPVSSLLSFMSTTTGTTINYKDVTDDTEKIKSITVPADFKNIKSLNEWLKSHTNNMLTEELTQSIEKFNESHSELSDEEKIKHLKKLHLIAKILKWCGAIIAVSFYIFSLLDRNFMKIGFIICAAYPVLLFLIMRFSNGEFRFDKKTTDIYPDILSPFCFCSVALFMQTITYSELVYSFLKQFLVSILVTQVMFFLYYICACSDEKKRKKNTHRCFSYYILLWIWIF